MTYKMRFPIVPVLLGLFSLSGWALGQSQPQNVVYNPVSVFQGAAQTAVKSFPAPAQPSGLVVGTFSNITGAPAGCNVSVSFTSTSGTTITTVQSTAAGIAVANGVSTWRVGTNPGVTSNAPLIGLYSQGFVAMACTTFPASGTAIFEFVPDPQPSFFYQHITSSTSTTQKTVPAVLHSIVVNAAGTGETITVFDSTSCSGTVIAVITVQANDQFFPFDITTANGLCVTTAGATPGDYTVVFR